MYVCIVHYTIPQFSRKVYSSSSVLFSTYFHSLLPLISMFAFHASRQLDLLSKSSLHSSAWNLLSLQIGQSMLSIYIPIGFVELLTYLHKQDFCATYSRSSDFYIPIQTAILQYYSLILLIDTFIVKSSPGGPVLCPHRYTRMSIMPFMHRYVIYSNK